MQLQVLFTGVRPWDHAAEIIPLTVSLQVYESDMHYMYTIACSMTTMIHCSLHV